MRELLHADFVHCAAERRQQLEWVDHLFRQATITAVSDDDDPKQKSIWEVLPPPGPASTSKWYLRPLQSGEIQVLEQQCRCRSSDWSKLRLALLLQQPQQQQQQQQRPSYDQPQSKLLQKLVSDTCFEGTCVLILAASSEEDDPQPEHNDDYLPLGLHQCAVVAHSAVHLTTARIHGCTRIVDTFIGAHAVVTGCGSITWLGTTTTTTRSRSGGAHQAQLTITVGPEAAGGRTLHLTPEATLRDVSRQLIQPPQQQPHNNNNNNNNNHQQQRNKSVIGDHCTVQDTPTVEAVYLHSQARIEGATAVRECVLHTGAKIRSAGTVTRAFLQWHAVIDQGSHVQNVLLMECAHVGPHGSVSQSLLGPDAHVSMGEVHASVLGPNTNAHHQSLVISVLAPLGRGNVGYGANVGSNHTGRLPDQECSAGEGVFWGLSCVVKFPVDLSQSPYSIVAAGTTLAPQRCGMPFSLIVNNNNSNSSDGNNTTSIIPGWVLRHSPYTVVRSEAKYAHRRHAVRHARDTGWKILRPETIQLCSSARAALRRLAPDQQNTHSTNKNNNNNVAGIGANALSEQGRLAGIQAYTDCIQQFALQGLYSWLVHHLAQGNNLAVVLEREFAVASNSSNNNSNIRSMDQPNAAAAAVAVDWPDFPWDTDQSSDRWWREQRSLLIAEFPRIPSSSSSSSSSLITTTTEWASHLLDRVFLELERAWAERVYMCKRRDDDRGRVTVPGYAAAHMSADQDPVIATVRKELRVKEETVVLLLRELQDPRSKL